MSESDADGNSFGLSRRQFMTIGALGVAATATRGLAAVERATATPLMARRWLSTR